MTVTLWNSLAKEERLARAAVLELGTGRRYRASIVSRVLIEFAAHEERGHYVIEAETDAGRRVWAKLELH